MDTLTIKQILATPLFSTLTVEDSECIEEGEVIEAPVGTVLGADGERTNYFHLILEGEVRVTRTYDRQSVLMGTNRAGDFMGETMLLLDIPWMATARVSKPARLYRLSEPQFWEMLSGCPSVAKQIFRSAANRMRNMEGYSQQREKLASLGTMAAGLAHELNNPAAAARRSAAHLRDTMDTVQLLVCELTEKLEHEHWDDLINSSQEALNRLDKPPVLDHLERSDRAELLATWLNEQGVGNPWDLSATFVSAGVDEHWLNALAEKLPEGSRADAIGWLGARLSLKSLLAQVDQSTNRIAELVKAVKSYSHMDQSPMQNVDVHEGIESTLTMLGHKMKNITLTRAFDHSLPTIMAYGSELNQVWTNLLDNAIDAVGGTGQICVGTCREDDQIVVEIVDDGPGIPMDVQARMFQPFFTTKSVGSGTGLGLVISNRIVADRHGGEIEFESKPGKTCFKVRLPINRNENAKPPTEELQEAHDTRN